MFIFRVGGGGGGVVCVGVLGPLIDQPYMTSNWYRHGGVDLYAKSKYLRSTS